MFGNLMFTSVDSFVKTWEDNVGRTTKIMEALTDDSLKQEVTNDHRTLGRMAWHVVTTISEMPAHLGMKLEGPAHTEPVPANAADIVMGYKTLAASLTEQIKGWNDDDMMIEDDLYGEKWKRGMTLKILIDHEIHHVGQMTVLMRQAGLKVPGLYGPSKEEWSNYGGQPPEV
jgi:uncharacterized damage-inducible protein DinB